MKTLSKFMCAAACTVILSGVSGCAGMSTQDRNTLIGAGAGAVGGSILTGGSTGGTLGGAAIGGVIGHEINKSK